MSENFGKKFEDLMKNQEMGEVLGPANGVFKAKFTDKYDEAIVLRELKSKEEYDRWYEEVGKDIEKNHGGKISMEFGLPELNSPEAKITKVEEPEKASADSKSFEDFMKKNKLEGIMGKEGYVFVVRGKNEGETSFQILEEFNNANEARDWYNSLGQLVIQGGGELKMDYGPSELNK